MSHIALEKAAYCMNEYYVGELVLICFPKENSHFESPCLRKYWRLQPWELEVLCGWRTPGSDKVGSWESHFFVGFCTETVKEWVDRLQKRWPGCSLDLLFSVDWVTILDRKWLALGMQGALKVREWWEKFLRHLVEMFPVIVRKYNKTDLL